MKRKPLNDLNLELQKIHNIIEQLGVKLDSIKVEVEKIKTWIELPPKNP